MKNEIILASAGSGKTYRLTNRFIALMLLDVCPERIIALTFTRKAAGEFFDAILEKLARSAADEEYAQQIAAGIGGAEFNSSAAARLLRVFVDSMPRLHLGTLDSFLADIVRSFPYEFGLGGEFEILDAHGLELERERVYERVLGDGGGNDFLESFKLATYGNEEAGVMRHLGRFVDELHAIYLGASAAQRWGNADAIWPAGCSWQRLEKDERHAIANALQARIDAAEIDPKLAPRWQPFLEWLPTYQAGSSVPREHKTLFGNLLKAFDAIRAGSAKVNVNRTGHELGKEECAALEALIGHVIADELDLRLRRTRGLWKVLDSYEDTYGRLARRRGKLTFSDLAFLLASPGAPGGRFASGASRREQIDYRLDARFEHWLLDEFQDTSALQWKAIENLVDEAVQDPEGRRSSFIVGDLKQAIYGWRGGDASLFADIRDKYRAMGPERFHEEPLDKSFRSSPAVIEMVNTVFPEGGAVAKLFPAMNGRWEFQPHSTEHSSRPGCAQWIAAPKAAGSDDKLQARLEIVAGVISRIDPLARGLSVAVLVGRNRIGTAAADYLRAATGLPVTNEAEVGIGGDNPLTAALCSLFRAAAHPGDGFALGHLRMTPFSDGFQSPAELVERVTGSVWRCGFEATVREWLELLPLSLDAFSAGRAEEFCRAAAAFDTTGSRSIDGFQRFIGNYSVRDSAAAGSVQVMTVHKSKGLGFDVVILPELEGDSFDIPRPGIAVQRDAQREVDWVLQLPNKDLAMADPILAEFIAERSADACYEQLCRHYVALTRAKYANYLVTDARSKSSTSKNFIKLLSESLLEEGSKETEGVLYEAGDASWFENLGPPAVPAEPKAVAVQLPSAGLRRPTINRDGADREAQMCTAAELFASS